jgi:hypothetical protein
VDPLRDLRNREHRGDSGGGPTLCGEDGAPLLVDYHGDQGL